MSGRGGGRGFGRGGGRDFGRGGRGGGRGGRMEDSGPPAEICGKDRSLQEYWNESLRNKLSCVKFLSHT